MKYLLIHYPYFFIKNLSISFLFQSYRLSITIPIQNAPFLPIYARNYTCVEQNWVVVRVVVVLVL